MVKIALVGDQHFSDVTPSCRVDNYCEEIFTLMQYILDYCAKEQAHVALLGDLFHRKRPNLNSHELVSRLILVFSRFKAQTGLRVFSMVGNHDFSYHIDTLPRQPISVLERAGAVELLKGTPVVFDDGKVELNGIPYGETTEQSPEAYNLPFVSHSSLKLWLFHATLLPDGDSFFGHWVNFNQIKDIAAHVVGCGHYHPGYDPAVIEQYGKLFINPGSISRGTAEDHNLTRQLQFVVLSFLDDGSVDYEIVPIPHAPAEKVFDMAGIQHAKARQSSVKKFISTVKERVADVEEISSVHGLMRLVRDITADEPVLVVVEKFLEEADEAIST